MGKMNSKGLGLIIFTLICTVGLLTGCGKPAATTGSETVRLNRRKMLLIFIIRSKLDRQKRKLMRCWGSHPQNR